MNGVKITIPEAHFAVVEGTSPSAVDSFILLSPFPAGFDKNNTIVIGTWINFGDGWIRGIQTDAINVITNNSSSFNGIVVYVPSTIDPNGAYCNKPIKVALMRLD